MKECLLCSEPLESGEFCDKTCERIYHERNSGKKIVGRMMTCECCGERIVRTSPRKKFCLHKCEPKPGGTYKCICCGEVKLLTDFYDNRDGIGIDGKRLSKCKTCTIKSQKRYSKREIVKPYDKTCVVCGKVFKGKGCVKLCSDNCRHERKKIVEKVCYLRKRRK